jgi:hypothetical protein
MYTSASRDRKWPNLRVRRRRCWARNRPSGHQRSSSGRDGCSRPGRRRRGPPRWPAGSPYGCTHTSATPCAAS